MKHTRNPDTYSFVTCRISIKCNQYNIIFPKIIDKFSNGLYLQITSLPINLFIRGTEILWDYGYNVNEVKIIQVLSMQEYNRNMVQWKYKPCHVILIGY